MLTKLSTGHYLSLSIATEYGREEGLEVWSNNSREDCPGLTRLGDGLLDEVCAEHCPSLEYSLARNIYCREDCTEEGAHYSPSDPW